MSAKGIQVKVKPQPVVVMEAEVARKIRQHSRSSMKAEVCGVLIGGNDQERTMIEACIPGINAAQGGAHVTFTQDTWEHIYKIKDQQFPDHKIVGWYHSHPGFGVFLSEHDLFIQENFFSSPQQVAWVYDPHTDEEGCFGWVGGKIEKLSGVRFGYLKSVEPGEPAATELEEGDDSGDLDPQLRVAAPRSEREPAWLIWTGRIMSYALAVVLGFGLGYLFVGWRVGPVFRAMDQKLQQYQAVLQQLEPMLRECQEKFSNSSTQDRGSVSQKSRAQGQPHGQRQPQPQPSGASADSAKGNNDKH